MDNPFVLVRHKASEELRSLRGNTRAFFFRPRSGGCPLAPTLFHVLGVVEIKKPSGSLVFSGSAGTKIAVPGTGIAPLFRITSCTVYLMVFCCSELFLPLLLLQKMQHGSETSDGTSLCRMDYCVLCTSALRISDHKSPRRLKESITLLIYSI
jgi:hypothetical protein